MLHAMEARLYVVHGSHPCAAVEKALTLKGIPYRTVELPPPMHAPIQRVLFGRRTVPGIRLDGEKVSGSRPILRRLEELRPEPPLFPADADERARVEEAERWGEETFQPVGRRLLWPAMKRSPGAMVSYSEHSKLPMPAPAIRLSAPLISRMEIALNRASDDAVQADLEALPGYLDRIDGWLEEGLLGGDPPNAADLQIAATLRLLMTLDDLRPLIEERPAGRLALRLFPDADGRMPAGSLPL
jgi:glutathione S-transferase